MKLATNLGLIPEMGRLPRGDENQPRTDAALFGHIAYKLEGKKGKELDAWAQALGIDVGADGLRKAPLHSARLQQASGRRPALRPWLAVDWIELNFFVVSARLRLERGDEEGERRSRGDEALDQLVRLPGVVDLHSLGEGALAQLIVVYEHRQEREALKRRLGEFGLLESWEEVDSHRPEAAISTSRALALEAAGREGLALKAR